MLSRAYLRNKDHTRSYEALKRAIAIDPQNATYWTAVGVLYFQVSGGGGAALCFTFSVLFIGLFCS
jgi:cytochrome c-type biogenesis protein CcmH/NrfG